MVDDRGPSELAPVANLRLGVVVVNYQSSALLAANLGRIDRGAIPSSTIVVVDNFSTAAERDAVRQLAHRRDWLLEAPESNMGFGAGVNRGVRRAVEARCDAFLLLNPDVVISPSTISALVAALPVQPHTALSPRLDMPDGFARLRWCSTRSADRTHQLQSGARRRRRRPVADRRLSPPDEVLLGPRRGLRRAVLPVLGGCGPHAASAACRRRASGAP